MVDQLRKSPAAHAETLARRVFMVSVRGPGRNRQFVCYKTSRRLSHIVRGEIIDRSRLRRPVINA